MKINSKHGLSNPLAISAATAALNSDEGKKTVGQTMSALKIAFIAFGTYAVGKWSYNKFKNIRSENFAKQNAGNPNLIAAAVIYDSFVRVGYPDSDFLSIILPEFNISADEDALYDIARKVTNVQAVSDAYSLLFDRVLFNDVRKGLSSKEMQSFWERINSPDTNTDKALYPIGSTLYVADKKGITVNKAVENNGQWKGTNILMDEYDFNSKVGVVKAHGIWTDESGKKHNYYIVEDFFWSSLGWQTGVVLQHQISNKQFKD